mgnify:CR=1 FL=1
MPGQVEGPPSTIKWEKRMEKVGFIGLGRMGRPMASNLCRRGFRLTVNDINPEAVAELELLQAGSAATVAEVAQKSDIIVTMLPIMLVFPFLQKYFLKGIMIGAIKA